MGRWMPLASDDAEQAALLEAMKATARRRYPGACLGKRLIAAVEVLGEGGFLWLETGRPHPREEEVIMALLHEETRDAILIFTPARGVWTSSPILVTAQQRGRIRYRRHPGTP